MSNTTLLPGSILSMTGAAADRLIDAGNGDAALLYLWLLRRAGTYQLPAAAKALRWELSRLEAAYTALVKQGLADPAVAQSAAPLEPQDEPPEYTAADISRELDEQASPFPALVSEVQRRLGKILSNADLKSLYTLYDYLALPAEVIFLLVNWCIEEMERKYGQGKRPRLPQIRKEGFAWKRRGIDTTEAAEGFLKRQAMLRTREAELLPMVGILGRAPIDEERRYLHAWLDMGFPDEAIRLAYERTVLQIQKMDWKYMNKILKSWHEKGLHTVEEVQAGDSPRPRLVSAPAPAAPEPPGQADQRAREDMDRLREFMRRQREEDAHNGG